MNKDIISQRKSLSELMDFKEFWSKKPCFKSMAVDGFEFNAIVNYKTNGKEIIGPTKVYLPLSGRDAPYIEIVESGKFISDFLHLRFQPEWQECKCDKEHNLIIKDSSEKCGNYIVKFQVIDEPYIETNRSFLDRSHHIQRKGDL